MNAIELNDNTHVITNCYFISDTNYYLESKYIFCYFFSLAILVHMAVFKNRESAKWPWLFYILITQ